MSKTVAPIVIACSADRRYLRPMAVMLTSLVKHLSPGRRVVAHVIDGGVSATERELLTRSLMQDPITLEWHRPDRSRLVGVPLWGRMSISVYDKLQVPDLLPDDVHQALWLDADTLVISDVAPLWDAGTGTRALMAVQDSLVPLVSSRFGVATYHELGLRPEAKYFNAGVMLMNLDAWRQLPVISRALAYLKTYANRVAFWDQEGLNAVLADQWGELDSSWNWSVSVGRPTGSRAQEAERARIVHFSGNLKPWTYDGGQRYYSMYYEVAGRTPWPELQPRPGVLSALLSAYERTRLRRLIYPAEQLGTDLLMSLTRRRASLADTRIPYS